MHHLRLAVVAAAICLGAPAALAADFSVSLSDGATPTAHVVVAVPASPNHSFRRNAIWIVSADPPGSASGWCTFRANIVPGPGVAGSFEIVAGSSGYDREPPGLVPQEPLVCAPLPNQVTDLTVLAAQ